MSGHTELLVDAVAVVDGEVLADAWVAVADGRIQAVGTGRNDLPRADVQTSLHGATLLPGFVDMHVHGGDGAAFGADEEANRRAAAFHLRHGTTALLPTLATTEFATMLRGARALGHAPEQEAGRARILGVHLEGPFLSPERRGAHDPALLLAPAADDFALLHAAAEGRLRLITTAPELPGYPELARAAAEAGVRLAAGHTDATGAQLRDAIAGGVGSLTHTFNAMRPIGQREPGVVEAIVDTDVCCELICDGIHVHPAVVRMLRTLAGPDRVVLVTDASEWAGSPDGTYDSPRRSVEIRDGAVRVAGTDTLAGSTATMLAAARNYAAFTGATLPELAAATSGNAARLLGEGHRLGAIRPGYAADLVVLDDRLECLAVMSAGTFSDISRDAHALQPDGNSAAARVVHRIVERIGGRHRRHQAAGRRGAPRRDRQEAFVPDDAVCWAG